MDFDFSIIDRIALLDADEVQNRHLELRAAASVASKPPKVWRIEDIGMLNRFRFAFPETYNTDSDTDFVKVSDIPLNKRNWRSVKSAWVRRADGIGDMFQIEIGTIIHPGQNMKTGISPA